MAQIFIFDKIVTRSIKSLNEFNLKSIQIFIEFFFLRK